MPDGDRAGGPAAGKVIVVMPAMNAAATLERTVAAIPRDWVDEVILVDDPSTDETVRLARSCRSASSGIRTTPATAPTRRPVTWRRSSATPTPS